MIYDNLIVDAELLKSGIAEAVSDYSDDDLQNLSLATCLKVIKSDILVSMGINTLDFDLVATMYESLLTNALRHLQRYHIINMVLENIYEGSVADKLRTEALNEYNNIKKKFSEININTEKKISNLSINANYL